MMIIIIMFNLQIGRILGFEKKVLDSSIHYWMKKFVIIITVTIESLITFIIIAATQWVRVRKIV